MRGGYARLFEYGGDVFVAAQRGHDEVLFGAARERIGGRVRERVVFGQHRHYRVVGERYPLASCRAFGVEAHFDATVVEPALELLPDALAYLDSYAGVIGAKGFDDVREPLD